MQGVVHQLAVRHPRVEIYLVAVLEGMPLLGAQELDNSAQVDRFHLWILQSLADQDGRDPDIFVPLMVAVRTVVAADSEQCDPCVRCI
jgi:hypothetical protein